MKSQKSIEVRTLVKAAFLTAISIVLTRFAYIMVPLAGLPALRVSFGEMPLMMSGLMFGPIVGGLSGIAADLIGMLINPQGAFHPGFTLSSMLWGVIPGVFAFFFRKNKNFEKAFSLRNISVAVFTTYILIALGLNTLWLSSMFGKGFFVLLPGRILSAIFNIPIQSILITSLIKQLKRLVNI